MRLFYIPKEKKSGSPICVLNAPENLATTKGVTKAWKNHDFINSISGSGDIIMEWTKTNKSDLGKSCVLTVENFKQTEIKFSDPEVRNWFCKGNFKRPGLENKPIVITDSKGKNRENTNKVVYKNCKFSLALNNAISSEKSSGATTILRVFEN
jgi:hypothetical protein